MLRTGQVYEHTACSGLDKYMNTQSALDWPGTAGHRMLRTGQISKHTECPELPRYKNTHRVHKTG